MPAESASIALLEKSRSAVTVCSLRLRPRWACPASSPTISPSRSSTKLWTSSTSASMYFGSAASLATISSRPRSSTAASSGLIAPQRPSARTHAREAAISSCTSRRSNGNERLNSQKTASGEAS